VARLVAAREQHGIHDCLVAIERTGRYHHAAKNAASMPIKGVRNRFI
jgi:hypothetical protein